MFCPQCGNEVEQHARFCSRCGKDLAPVIVHQRAAHDMSVHVNILGWLFIGSAVLMGMVGMLIISAGGFIRHIPMIMPVQFPIGLAHLAGGVAVFAGLMSTAIAAGVAAAGIGLLQYRSWARVLAIIMSVMMILKFPLGTAIAIYAFWVLFSQQGQEHYRARSAATMA